MIKNKIKFLSYIVFFVFLCSFSHKFYVSITQIEYNASKKQIQIATRYFIDDVEKAIFTKFQEKIYIDTKTMTEIQKKMVEEYIIANYLIKINSKNQTINYLGFEIENDIIIMYLTINNVKKINTLDVKINTLFETIETQQHIVHTEINDKKCSLLLTEDNRLQSCKY